MKRMGLALLVLGACTPEQDKPVTPLPQGTPCGAAKLQHLVGAPIARFDPDTQAGPVRILPPGSAMTMDHRPERLNVDLDANGLITRLWCG